jgi:hypothetical protein
MRLGKPPLREGCKAKIKSALEPPIRQYWEFINLSQFTTIFFIENNKGVVTVTTLY